MESAFIKLHTITSIWILDPYACTVQHTDMIACHSTLRPFAASAGTEFNYDVDHLQTCRLALIRVTDCNQDNTVRGW